MEKGQVKFENGSTEFISKSWQPEQTQANSMGGKTRDDAAYIAELEAKVRDMEWRPIETILEDSGEVILLNVERNITMTMKASHFYKTKDYPSHLRFFASYWMPLPPAPTKKQNY